MIAPAGGSGVPVRSHRRRSGMHRLSRVVLSTVLILVALTAGGFIIGHTPDADRQQEPFVRKAGPGAPVPVRTFQATVLGVRGAPKIVSGGQTFDTGGIWVLVRVRLVARADPVNVGYAALRDSAGRLYRDTERLRQPLVDAGRDLQPGIPVTGEVVFEVPVAVATGLSLRLAVNAYDERLDAMTQIDLRVDSAMVAAWRSAQPATLSAPDIA